MLEIERKYLARANHTRLLQQPVTKDLHVTQGYLIAADTVEWRLRQTRYFTPNKGLRYHTAIKLGNGYVRREYEWEISGRVFSFLARFVPRWLQKSRVSTGGWEIDTFSGAHHGLTLAEYEVPSADDPMPPIPEGLTLVRDVTDGAEFANKRLSRLTPEAASTFVYEAYRPAACA